MRKSKNLFKYVDGVRVLWNGFDYDVQRWVIEGVTFDDSWQAVQAVQNIINRHKENPQNVKPYAIIASCCGCGVVDTVTETKDGHGLPVCEGCNTVQG